MMAEVVIKKDGKKGKVSWEEDGEKVSNVRVVFPDANMRRRVERYLKRERPYRIQKSNKMDDFRVEEARPVKGLMYLELALSELWSKTEVYVDWV